MIELEHDGLTISFPEVHPAARQEVAFQRTLRIPDDGSTYRLPPGLGRFPLRHVDDFGAQVPEGWRRRGGVMLPMYQSEAMWLSFGSRWGGGTTIDGFEYEPYPFALKIAAGKINAVSGATWTETLSRSPQDYVVLPEQPWLDGFAVARGLVRQFVAMPLGAGYTAEEQRTGAAEYGGLQIFAVPMKPEVYERRFPPRRVEARCYSRALHEAAYCAAPDMGLAPGGRMRQKVYRDPFQLSDWDLEHTSRCFVHLTNSMVWRSITGEEPPTTPPTAREYSSAGLPWFDLYDESVPALGGAKALAGLESIRERAAKKGDMPLPENESVRFGRVHRLLRKWRSRKVVREGM